MPKILSVNVSLPKEVDFEGQKVTTGIFKEPVERRVMLKTLNLEGDRQADLTVHGGPDKAVYAYAVEHYEYWRKVFPTIKMLNGMFGENFTTEDLMERRSLYRRCFSNRIIKSYCNTTKNAML